MNLLTKLQVYLQSEIGNTWKREDAVVLEHSHSEEISFFHMVVYHTPLSVVVQCSQEDHKAWMAAKEHPDKGLLHAMTVGEEIDLSYYK